MAYKAYLPWPSQQELENLINKHGSFSGAAKEFGCGPETMRMKAKKLKLNVNCKHNIYTKTNWPHDDIIIELINKFGSYRGAAKALNCDEENLRMRSIRRNYQVDLNKKSYECNSKVFTDENALSYYLLGAYMSDGNVEKNTNRIGIISKDKEWIESIRDLISPDSPLQVSNEGRTFIFRFSSKKVRDWLIKNECVPCKSLICKMPNVPKQYFRDFVRGIFDGDGSVSCKFELGQDGITRIKILNAYICSGSKTFLNELYSQFCLENIHCLNRSFASRDSKMKDGRIIHPTGTENRIIFNAQFCYHFLKWIYYPNHQIHLERKYLKALEIFHYFESENIKHTNKFRLNA